METELQKEHSIYANLTIARMCQALHNLVLDLCTELLADSSEQKIRFKNLLKQSHYRKKQERDDEDPIELMCRLLARLETKIEECYIKGHDPWVKQTGIEFAQMINEGIALENWKEPRKHLWQSKNLYCVYLTFRFTNHSRNI